MFLCQIEPKMHFFLKTKMASHLERAENDSDHCQNSPASLEGEFKTETCGSKF